MSIEDDFKYFREHHSELYDKYPGQYVVISNREVLFAADTFQEAFERAISRGREPGGFLVQLCTPGEDGYTQTFHSRAIFSQ